MPLPVAGRVDRCWDVVPAGVWREHCFIRSLMVLPRLLTGTADEDGRPVRLFVGMTGPRTITTSS